MAERSRMAPGQHWMIMLAGAARTGRSVTICDASPRLVTAVPRSDGGQMIFLLRAWPDVADLSRSFGAVAGIRTSALLRARIIGATGRLFCQTPRPDAGWPRLAVPAPELAAHAVRVPAGREDACGRRRLGALRSRLLRQRRPRLQPGPAHRHRLPDSRPRSSLTQAAALQSPLRAAKHGAGAVKHADNLLAALVESG